MTTHEKKIVSILKKRWATQMDMALQFVTLNLSKRLGDIEPKLSGWKIERRWRSGGMARVKEYKIIRK